MTGSSSHSSTALLDHLARVSRARTDEALASLDLRARHLIALTLLRDSGPMTQQAMVLALAIDRTNVVGLLNELESAGLVERQRSESDRRRHIVALTDSGSKRLADAEKQLAANEALLLHSLSAGERATLYELLQRATAGYTVDCVAASGLRDGAEGAAARKAASASG